MSRYIVQTEHIRGEPRIYWVEDTRKKYGKGYGQATDHTTDKRKAERWCDDLNDAARPDVSEGKERSDG